jgi:hypothetical protein
MRHGTKPLALALACAGVLAAPARGAEDEEMEALRRQVEALARDNAEMRGTIQRLERDVERARDEARSAEDTAREVARAPAVSAAPADAGALASTPLGGARLQLIDLSLDVMTAFGSSSATDEELELLQAGDHDPRQRGFTLQQAELSLRGAVDPYFDGEAHLLYGIDPEGETKVELEEAFATTRMLPFGLERQGFQLKVGHFLTEFGRQNAVHPHAWDWLDQPVVLSRFFGGDGMRAPGARVGWLTPLPWYSEVFVGAQNAKGETMVSFLANDEVFDDRPIGGREFSGTRVRGLDDLVFLGRWVNGFDLSPTWSAQIGVSGLVGPNATGPDGRTHLFGADAVVKWRPLATDRGWPFVKLTAEFLHRNYQADSFLACGPPDPEPEEDPLISPDDDDFDDPEEIEPPNRDTCPDRLFVAGDRLRDWGGYAEILWGFRRGWALGLRGEYASGEGDSLGPYGSREADPFRDDRLRISPLLVFHPSEFSRIRLQYNYDHADHLRSGSAHSVWAGLEILFGSHPAHAY